MKSDMPDSDVDYDEIKSSERRYVVLNGAENPYNIKTAINEFQKYSITDVAIEYLKNISDKESENKEAEITTWSFSFERNKMLFEIKMKPGSIILKDIDRSYWQKFQNLTITTSRQYHEQKDKVKKNVIALQFNSVDVSLSDIGWFKNRLINDLLYINVTIIDTSLKAWETFAECLSTLK
uniref:Uncharacterized protein n=1 Tax=Panagrolaimus sp. PS1159 TaxID=55785 RepID=A0AC35GJ20_9BILA